MPFFHPTVDTGSEGEERESLELSIKERLSNDSNKLSFEVLLQHMLANEICPPGLGGPGNKDRHPVDAVTFFY
jgi:hypothetical protein